VVKKPENAVKAVLSIAMSLAKGWSREEELHGVSPVKWENLGDVGEQVDTSRS